MSKIYEALLRAEKEKYSWQKLVTNITQIADDLQK